MASVSFHIETLLEKMTSPDKDFRLIATKDLMSELQEDSINLDDDSERKVVRTLLKLLEDKNGEVQHTAVKCLRVLVNKVKETQVETIVDTLCTNMVSDNEELRHVSSMILEIVISELPASSHPLTTTLCCRVTPRLVSAIIGHVAATNIVSQANQQQNVDVNILWKGLNILADLLLRYGGLLVQFHATIEELLMPLLAGSVLDVRKCAIVALANLTAVCSQNLFSAVCEHLFDALEQNQSLSTTRTYVEAVGAVCRAAGHRFGVFLPKFIPVMMNYCDKIDDDELREGCLESFESILLRCPEESSPYVTEITNLCSKYLCYDTNYNYYEDGDMVTDNMENGDMETDQSQVEYEYDDGDTSCGVRCASANCLKAILGTRREILVNLYRGPGALLISRFKERDANVRVCIFKAYIALLKHTKLVVPSEDFELDDTGLLILLRAQLPQVIKGVTKQLNGKSLETKHTWFALFTELLGVYSTCLSSLVVCEFGLFLPGVQRSLMDKQASSNVKIGTLVFVGAALAGGAPEMFHRFMPQLVPLIVNAMDDRFYVVAAKALNVAQQLIRVLRPADTPSSSFDFTPHVTKLYAAVFTKLKATDIDQEVKQRAITCTGYMLVTFGDFLQAELPVCLPLLHDQLKNKGTRLTTVQALTLIVQTPLKISLESILPSVVNDLAEYLREDELLLRSATVQLLDSFYTNHQASMTPVISRKVLAELMALIVKSDIPIFPMTLTLLANVLKQQPSIASEFIDQILAVVVGRLLHSRLLQYTPPLLNALNGVLLQVIQSGRPSFMELKTLLVKPIYDRQLAAAPHHPYFRNAAKCLAALVAVHQDEAPAVASNFIEQMNNSGIDQDAHFFALLVLGEIGRIAPKAISDTSPCIDQAIMQGIQSQSADLNIAASLALAGVAVGNLEKYLPTVLREIETEPKRRYSLLCTLKEIIDSESTMVGVKSVSAKFKPHMDRIWTVLLSNSGYNDMKVRLVVAQSLGQLCRLEPERLLPMLKEHLIAGGNSFVQTTVITAFKFTIVNQPRPIDAVLGVCIGEFLQSLTDHDLDVRRMALETLTAAAFYKPSLLNGEIMAVALPHVFAEMKVRRELIREVDEGPFKHTVDDGLRLREAAFECICKLLRACPKRLDVFEVLSHVEDGLKDHHDIKEWTYSLLIRLASVCPTQMLQRLDRLLDLLKQNVLQKIEEERMELDELKSALCALQAIPDADKNPKLKELLDIIRTTEELTGTMTKRFKCIH